MKYHKKTKDGKLELVIPESFFGIMYGWGGSDWTTKTGYADLKDAIGQY
jgi:hypothetical protein